FYRKKNTRPNPRSYTIRFCQGATRNPLKHKARTPASKKIQKSPQASCHHDDNYYEGSLGHTRRLPGPEAAVFI
ncbi:hypothetical protein NTD86_14150, partial [Pseudomonas sp. 7P_10.2_Bac1]|uniref:hypothetical protein n=1 Tax=Pseudomonas sp. 7P_10.2_Bac1 TaxID=2971614 RepID=UPI0021C7641F